MLRCILDPNLAYTEHGQTMKILVDRAKFYELDFFKNNFFLHIIENFSEEGDEGLFKELTTMVLKDIAKDGSVSEIAGVQMDLFDTTVRFALLTFSSTGTAKATLGCLSTS